MVQKLVYLFAAVVAVFINNGVPARRFRLEVATQQSESSGADESSEHPTSIINEIPEGNVTNIEGQEHDGSHTVRDLEFRRMGDELDFDETDAPRSDDSTISDMGEALTERRNVFSAVGIPCCGRNRNYNDPDKNPASMRRYGLTLFLFCLWRPFFKFFKEYIIDGSPDPTMYNVTGTENVSMLHGLVRVNGRWQIEANTSAYERLTNGTLLRNGTNILRDEFVGRRNTTRAWTWDDFFFRSMMPDGNRFANDDGNVKLEDLPESMMTLLGKAPVMLSKELKTKFEASTGWDLDSPLVNFLPVILASYFFIFIVLKIPDCCANRCLGGKSYCCCIKKSEKKENGCCDGKRLCENGCCDGKKLCKKHCSPDACAARSCGRFGVEDPVAFVQERQWTRKWLVMFEYNRYYVFLTSVFSWAGLNFEAPTVFLIWVVMMMYYVAVLAAGEVYVRARGKDAVGDNLESETMHYGSPPDDAANNVGVENC